MKEKEQKMGYMRKALGDKKAKKKVSVTGPL